MEIDKLLAYIDELETELWRLYDFMAIEDAESIETLLCKGEDIKNDN